MENLEGSDSHRDIALEVFERVRNVDLGVADLYSATGSVVREDGVWQGRETIRTFYRDAMAEERPYPIPKSVHCLGDMVVVMLEVTNVTGVHQVADVFTIEAGEITKLEICRGCQH